MALPGPVVAVTAGPTGYDGVAVRGGAEAS
jgi:hypothetical protein